MKILSVCNRSRNLLFLPVFPSDLWGSLICVFRENKKGPPDFYTFQAKILTRACIRKTNSKNIICILKLHTNGAASKYFHLFLFDCFRTVCIFHATHICLNFFVSSFIFKPCIFNEFLELNFLSQEQKVSGL